MKQVTIYTDGACSKNPGPGGWGAVLIYREHRREMSGYECQTTNNRMELTAAIEALSALKEPCDVSLYTDSSYLSKAFNDGWMDKWIKHNWMLQNHEPVRNRDLWQRLLELTDIHNVKWFWIKGHAKNEENNRCDELASQAIRQNPDNHVTECG